MSNIAKSVEPRSAELVVQMSLFENNCTTPFFLPVEAPKTKPFELREYQKRVIQELTELYKQGLRRPFVYAPTGSGKTAIAAKILANSINKGRRCLFLVHRDPLVEQTQEALAVYETSPK